MLNYIDFIFNILFLTFLLSYFIIYSFVLLLLLLLYEILEQNKQKQSVQEKNQLEIANLKYENESLRNRLRDVVNSPLSDAEKHQIIQDSQRLHSSAPASIALPTVSFY